MAQNQAHGMSERELRAIESRAKSASPGPWVVRGNAIIQPQGMGRHVDREILLDKNLEPRDLEFIAHARQDVPALAAEVRRLRAALEKLRQKHRSGEWPDEAGNRETTCPVASGLSDECTCGAARHNAIIDEALRQQS